MQVAAVGTCLLLLPDCDRSQLRRAASVDNLIVAYEGFHMVIVGGETPSPSALD